MSRVFHFELHADDPERAGRFYGEVFGWTFTKWRGVDYWYIRTGSRENEGIDGELAPRRSPMHSVVPIIGVGSIEESVAKIIALGGRELERVPFGGAGILVYCRDTEGNIFGLLEGDESGG